MTCHTLKKCKPEAVRRLAKHLKLRKTDSMSIKQVIRLIIWRLHRNRQMYREHGG